MTPFSSCESVTRIKTMRIFCEMKLKFLKYVDGPVEMSKGPYKSLIPQFSKKQTQKNFKDANKENNKDANKENYKDVNK